MDVCVISAEAFDLPLLPPSSPEEASSEFATGANFAVYASTALPPEYYKKNYNFTIYVPSHLEMQLDAFKKVLARIAPGDSKFLSNTHAGYAWIVNCGASATWSVVHVVFFLQNNSHRRDEGCTEQIGRAHV